MRFLKNLHPDVWDIFPFVALLIVFSILMIARCSGFLPLL